MERIDTPAAIFPEFPFSPHGTRRRFLTGLAGTAAAAALVGCASQPPSSTSAISYLPDGVLPPDASISPGQRDTGYAPPANFKPRVVYHPPTPSKQIVPVGAFGIIPRSAWALAGPNMRTIQPMAGVHLITFHHTGDPHPIFFDTLAETARYWELIREYERRVGFEDIAYHFGIDRMGRVWQLRDLEYRGEHVRDGFAPPHWLMQYIQYRSSPTQPVHGRYIWNAHNIGVASIGNFMIQEPTIQQKQTILRFGTLLRRLYNIPIYHCYTHRELVATECPGHNLQPYMVYIRKNNIL